MSTEFTAWPGDMTLAPEYTYVPSLEWQYALDQSVPGFTELMQEQTTTPTQSWIDTATRLVSVAGMTYAQQQLLNIQLQRARQGLPPLDASAYTPGVAVNVGIDPKLRNALLLGGAVLLGVFLMRQKG